MKALILKDFFLMQKQLKVMAIVMVLYLILFVPMGMADMIPFMLVMFAAMYTMTSMSFDETLKWDVYALSSPLNRRQVVRAKYLFALLLIFFTVLLDLVFYLLLPFFTPPLRLFWQSLVAIGIMSFAALIWLSVLIPPMYKLGVEKSRLLMVGAILLPIGAVMLYSKYAPPELTAFFIKHTAYLPPVLLLLAIASFAVSYKFSLNIYMKKEF